VSGKGEPASDKERAQLIKRHLAAMDGPLACERIMGVLDRWVSGEGGFPKSSAMGKVYSLTLNAGRNAVKQIKAALPGSYNRPAFQRHRYPPLTLNDVRNRVMRFQHLLGVRRELKIETLLGQFFRLST
jgi:hypothetical protein